MGIAWEYIIGTFNPTSPFLTIKPETAFHLIVRAIDEKWTALGLCCQIHADHSSEDDDSETNCKTKSVRDIMDTTRRYKEIHLGGVNFLDSNGHMMKSYTSGDYGHKRPKQRAQFAVATEKRMEEDHDVSWITDFFNSLIYDVGVHKLDIQVYLRSILPHWTNKYNTYMQGVHHLFLSPRFAITPTNLSDESDDDGDKKPRVKKRAYNDCYDKVVD
jgi:hypothetical protein